MSDGRQWIDPYAPADPPPPPPQFPAARLARVAHDSDGAAVLGLWWDQADPTDRALLAGHLAVMNDRTLADYVDTVGSLPEAAPSEAAKWARGQPDPRLSAAVALVAERTRAEPRQRLVADLEKMR